MKKVAILVAIALVLGISLAAYAGATKYELIQGPTNPAITGEESGFVIVNDADDQQTVIQFQVRGLTPGIDYYMYYGVAGVYPTFGPIQVNRKGFGHFHINVEPPITLPKYAVGISDADPTLSKDDTILYALVGDW